MFAAIGTLVAKYPRWVLGAWFVLALASLPFGIRVGEVLTGQPAAPDTGDANAVKRVLAAEFAQSEEDILVVIAYGGRLQAGDAAYDEALDVLIGRLTDLDEVTYVRDHRSAAGLVLLNEEDNFSILQIGLDTDGLADGKSVTGAVRAVLATVPELRYDLSGGPATVIELEQVSERDARRAELFGLPISLLILLIAFGALVASALPLISAVTTISVSSALLFFLGQHFEFAVFTETIVTMLGLATGIDYALLIVNRYREELRANFDPREAARVTAMTAGKAVAFSGLTVLVALSALLVPPVVFIRSIGLGAMVVLLVSVLVAITAVPATLALLGHRINWLKVTKREPGLRSRAFWRARAHEIMRRPWLWAITGVSFLLLLALPALRMQVADPGARGLSEATEARRTLTALESLGLEGVLNPFDVLVDFGNETFYHPSRVRQVSLLAQELSAIEGVSSVMSPFALEGIPRLFLYQYYASAELALNSEVEPLVRATVSDNGRYVLFRVYPDGTVTPAVGAALHDQIAARIASVGLSARIGGTYVEGTEWTAALYDYFPLALALVALATAVLLGLAFRSLLIPIKAVILNVLTVGASFGVLTLVMQDGVLSNLFGLPPALGYIDTSAPLFIFAIVFGLSMDYEVFMVARIHEGHERGLSDKEAVATALSTTGGVITSAAAIMITIFVVLMFSHVELIRTLGLGLSVAVLLDATLVRLALVPSVMVLAGRWNWWLPGKPLGPPQNDLKRHDPA
ncbi:MAG: MMPL family transporter [Trueperaceae bacterium]